MPRAIVSVALGTLSALCLPSPASALDGPFKPECGKAILRIGDHAIGVLSVRTTDGPEHVAGDLCLEFGQGWVVARRSGAEVWKAECPGDRLTWATGQGGTGYLTPSDRHGRPSAALTEQLRPIDLATGRWGAPVTLQHGGAAMGGEIRGIVFTSSGLAVAASTKGGTLVDLFPLVDGVPAPNPAWSKLIPPEPIEGAPQDGAALLAATYPDRASASLTELALVDDVLVVCAGPREPLRGVDVGSGEEQWTLERPWEYQRSFIGPSVWNHEMERFGADSLLFHENEEALRKHRGEFDAQWFGTLLAGPAAAAGAESFFVIVGRAPRGPWTNFLVEPFALEVSSYGRALSTTALPRRPLGHFASNIPGSVVWVCNSGTLIAVTHTDEYAEHSGPGGTDCVSDVSWMRRSGAQQHWGWLCAPGIDGLTALAPGAAYVAGDMWIERESDTNVRMSLARVDLTTGAEQALTLEVPFSGKPAVPASNYMSRGGRDRERQTRSIGPYLIGITGLRAGSGTLLVTVGRQDDHDTLEFAIPGM